MATDNERLIAECHQLVGSGGDEDGFYCNDRRVRALCEALEAATATLARVKAAVDEIERKQQETPLTLLNSYWILAKLRKALAEPSEAACGECGTELDKQGRDVDGWKHAPAPETKQCKFIGHEHPDVVCMCGTHWTIRPEPAAPPAPATRGRLIDAFFRVWCWERTAANIFRAGIFADAIIEAARSTK